MNGCEERKEECFQGMQWKENLEIRIELGITLS
jgi:hypothetical protein